MIAILTWLFQKNFHKSETPAYYKEEVANE